MKSREQGQGWVDPTLTDKVHRLATYKALDTACTNCSVINNAKHRVDYTRLIMASHSAPLQTIGYKFERTLPKQITNEKMWALKDQRKNLNIIESTSTQNVHEVKPAYKLKAKNYVSRVLFTRQHDTHLCRGIQIHRNLCNLHSTFLHVCTVHWGIMQQKVVDYKHCIFTVLPQD